MIPLDAENIDQIVEEFSSDELVNLSDDLLRIAIELTLQEDLDIAAVNFNRGNELLVIIPKVIASRLNKAETFVRKFAEIKKEDLIFVGYSLAELTTIKKLFEDVITLFERRTPTDLHALYHEIFEELKTSIEFDVTQYRQALENVNEAFRIQSRHVMTRAIEVYKRVTAYDFELFLHEEMATLEKYREYLGQAVQLIETSDLDEKFAAQLQGLRNTLILVLEALNTNTIGAGFSEKKIAYSDEILHQIRHEPEAYIFQVIRRFARVSPEHELLDYMKPEEIAIRYRTRYIKHNRVLLSLISNPIDVAQDFVLEVTNNILKNLSTALNVKLQFIRTGQLCDRLLALAAASDAATLSAYTQEELNQAYIKVADSLSILEGYTIRSDYLEALQEKCYRTSILILEWFKDEFVMELAEILRRYQIYAARKLFTLRISTMCLVISSRTPADLVRMASQKILGVCRDLIQYRYDFLKPSSVYLESRFDLEKYRMPVLDKLEEAIQLIETHRAEIEQRAATPQEKRAKSLFSQMTIDSLALKVQELDDSPQSLARDKTLTKREIRLRITTSKDRIRYFLKQYEEDRQLFLKHYQSEQLEELFQP